jgi:ribosomal protein S18 acetylase RimI-like enzyme
MKKVELKPISPEEYSSWSKSAQATYALEKEKSGLTKQAAEEEAEKAFRTMLSDGPNTPDNFVYSVVEIASAKVVGTLWWQKREKNTAWVCDIILNEDARGKGYGRETMLLCQEAVKAQGIPTLGLHVFGHNEIAQNLYRSLGFSPTNIVMSKKL